VKTLPKIHSRGKIATCHLLQEVLCLLCSLGSCRAGGLRDVSPLFSNPTLQAVGPWRQSQPLTSLSSLLSLFCLVPHARCVWCGHNQGPRLPGLGQRRPPLSTKLILGLQLG
jgi:hypothetical protein